MKNDYILKEMVESKIIKITEDLQEFTKLAEEYFTRQEDKTDLDKLRSITVVTTLRDAVDEIIDLRCAITVSDEDMQESLDEVGVTAREVLTKMMMVEMMKLENIIKK